jgi:E3 ubiquitin-protein ligase TRIP12
MSLAMSRSSTACSRLVCRGVPVSLLSQCLDFVLPGNPDLPLSREDGSLYASDTDVTLTNLGEYVDAVCRTMLVTSVAPQVAAFQDGFAEYGSLSGLQLFTAAELASLLSAGTEMSDHLWQPRSVAKHIVCQHGYTAQSVQVRAAVFGVSIVLLANGVFVACVHGGASLRDLLSASLRGLQIQNLLTVISEMSKDDKRLFLRFISGSPRLPIGGFAGLSPRLTVVKAVATLGS